MGTTISPDGEQKIDVYVYSHGQPAEPYEEVCIRFGSQPSEYRTSEGITPEDWCDAKRVVLLPGGKTVPAARFDGPAMELVRAFYERKKEATNGNKSASR